MGIVSEFHYATGDFIDRMTTPYGTTTFASGTLAGVPPVGGGEGYPGRWVEAVDPYGDKERAEQNDLTGYPAGGVDPNPPPGATPDGSINVGVPQTTFRPKTDNLHWRNTYYWDKKAWSMGPGDYAKATIYNWLANSAGTITGILGSIKRPLEGRVWFNYHGQVSNHSPGSIASPSLTLRAVESATAGQPPEWTVSQTRYTQPNNQPHPYGAQTGSVDEEGREFRYIYDLTAQDVTEVQLWLEDAFHQGENAWRTIYTANYDFNGATSHRPNSVNVVGQQRQDFTYNWQGQVKTITTINPTAGGSNEVTRISYEMNFDGVEDDFGYPVKIERTDPANAAQWVTVAQYTYDAARRVRTSTDESGYTLTYDYDDFDRVTLVNHPDGTTEQSVYQNLSLVAVKDRGGLWTRYHENALQQRVLEQEPQGRITQYQWCKCGALSAITDALGRTTRWKRDEQGRVISKTLPDGTTKITYAYEPLSGRLSTITQPNDQGSGHPTVTYRHAAAGQLVSEDYHDPATPDATYHYNYGATATPDPLGRLTWMEDGTGGTTFEYWAFTRQLWRVNGPAVDDTVSFAYDWRRRMTGFSVLRDNGTVLATETASFDALGRTASLVNGLGTFDYTYNPGNLSGRVDSIAGPNGWLTALSYFPLNATGGRALRLQGIAHSRAGAALSAFGYDYDPSGRITSWSRQASAAAATAYSLAYNRSSELLEAVLKDNVGAVLQSYSYRYDAAGNRHLSGEGGAAPQLRQHNALNALTQIGGAGKTSVEGTVDEPSTVKVNGQPTTIVALPGTSLWKYERQIEGERGRFLKLALASPANLLYLSDPFYYEHPRCPPWTIPFPLNTTGDGG